MVSQQRLTFSGATRLRTERGPTRARTVGGPSHPLDWKRHEADVFACPGWALDRRALVTTLSRRKQSNFQLETSGFLCGFPLSAEWVCQQRSARPPGIEPPLGTIFQRRWISEVGFALFLLRAHPLQDQQGDFVRRKRTKSDETCGAFRPVRHHRLGRGRCTRCSGIGT